MGAMACDRNGCEHVMCRRTIFDGALYICDACYAELLEFKETWGADVRPSDVRSSIAWFMRECAPGTYGQEPETVDEAFARLTGG